MGYQVQLDRNNNAIVCGKTNSYNDFPTTSGAFDEGPNSGYDSYVMKWMALEYPSAPRDLRAYGSELEIILRWAPPQSTGNSSIMNYTIYRGVTPNNLNLLERIGNQTYFFDSSVYPGTEYFYRVTATNGIFEGPPSDIVSYLPGIVPSAPLNLTAASGNGTVSLKWNHSLNTGLPGMSGYLIYRSQNISLFELFAVNPSTKRDFIDDTVVNGLDYFYYVTAKNLKGESERSVIVTASPSTKPGPPMHLETVSSDSIVDLIWSEPVDDGGSPVIRYNVFRGGEDADLTEYDRVPYPTQTYSDAQVVNGRLYTYVVAAVNSNGRSQFSNKAVGQPLGSPSAPENLTAVGKDGSVSLVWETAKDTGGFLYVSYMVYRKVPGGAPVLVEDTTGTLYMDKDVENGVVYEYYVVAYNDVGTSDMSNMVRAQPMGLPSRPIGVELTAGDGYIRLSWERPLDDGGDPLLTYSVYRSMDGEYFDIQDTGDGSSREFLDKDVQNGDTYHYHIKARNMIGLSMESEVVRGIPKGIPDKPLDLVSTSGNGFVELDWKPPEYTGGTVLQGIHVFRTGGNMADRLLGTVRTEPWTFRDNSVANGIIYHYYLVAFNEVGNSTRSVNVKGFPGSVPGAPVLNVSIQGDGLLLTWTVPTDLGGRGILEYRIYRGAEDGSPVLINRSSETVGSFLDLDIHKGVKYLYTVKAYNELGEGPGSNQVSGIVEKEEEEKELTIPLLISLVALLLLIILVLLVLIILMRRGPRKSYVQGEQDAEPIPVHLPPSASFHEGVPYIGMKQGYDGLESGRIEGTMNNQGAPPFAGQNDDMEPSLEDPRGPME
ncbi:MAG: fibronectin type III domain-containing protein [Thermoplasmatota archaeon]